MKKVLDFLEQKVEWVVLLAGIAFAGYIAWAYVINSPIYVELNGEKRGPGEVDNIILEGVATKLDGEMRDTSARTAVTPPRFVDDFRDKMSYAKQAAEASNGDALVLWPQTPMIKFSDLPSVPGSSGGTSGGEAPVIAGLGTVAKLPQVPTPQLIATRSDMSYVAIPGQQSQPQPTNSEDPDRPAVAAAPVAPIGGMDRTWASVLYTIDAAALAKEWEQAHLPTANTTTFFLQVLLERQELKPDGTWSDPLPLPPLAVGVNIPPAPAGSRLTGEAQGYLSWAAPHQLDILRPGFYTIIKGKKWAPPGVDSAMAQTEEKFDPTKYLDPKADVSKLTMEQRQLVFKARATKAAEAAKARRPAGRPQTGNAEPAGELAPEQQQSVLDPDRPASYAAADPVAASNAGAPANPAAKAPPSRTPGAAAPSTAQLAASPIPGGEFDPSKWIEDHPGQSLIVGWAHDETVQASHTYRYRVTYRLKNPVLFAASAVKDPKLADQLDIRSSPSEWSANVEVRPAVNFWLVRASETSGVAAVDVFRWQGGDAKRKTFNVSAGDMIGGKEGAIDYATGWSIVDLRKDLRTDKVYVLLMDPSGSLQRRDVDSDSADPKYLELKQQSTSAAGPAPAGSPTASR